MTAMTVTGMTVTTATTRTPRSARLRLTRRGRAVRSMVLALMLTLTLMVLLVSLLSQSMVSASTDESEGPALRTIVVEPGQTLWQIATDVAPYDDPRDTVIRLEQINGLTGAQIGAGQQLLVPVTG